MSINFYPQELGTNAMPHCVRFYINARDTHVSARQPGGIHESNAEYQLSLSNENRAKAENYESAMGKAGFFVAGIGMLATGSKLVTGEGASSFTKTIAAPAVAGLASAAVANGVANNTKSVRLKDEIALYVPQSIITTYAAEWDETSTGVAGAFLSSGNKSLSSAADLFGGTGEMLARGVIGAAAKLPQAIGAEMDVAGALEASSKKVENPYKEQLFKSMGFRQFSFQYVFSPRNEKESQQVENIVGLFKEHMHPDVAAGDLFLIYPSEFSIEFHTLEGNTMVKNDKLPSISSCALKNCKVTYGPDGMFNTFKDGFASEVIMELQFVELEMLTGERIRGNEAATQRDEGILDQGVLTSNRVEEVDTRGTKGGSKYRGGF